MSDETVADRAYLETLIREALTTDGAHHKQWFLERIAEELGVDIGRPDDDYESGIAP